MLLWHFSLEMQRDMLETDVALRLLQDKVDSLPLANQVDPASARDMDSGTWMDTPSQSSDEEEGGELLNESIIPYYEGQCQSEGVCAVMSAGAGSRKKAIVINDSGTFEHPSPPKKNKPSYKDLGNSYLMTSTPIVNKKKKRSLRAQVHDAGKRQRIERMVSHVDDDRQIISYANIPPKKQVRVSDRKGKVIKIKRENDMKAYGSKALQPPRYPRGQSPVITSSSDAVARPVPAIYQAALKRRLVVQQAEDTSRPQPPTATVTTLNKDDDHDGPQMPLTSPRPEGSRAGVTHRKREKAPASDLSHSSTQTSKLTKIYIHVNLYFFNKSFLH